MLQNHQTSAGFKFEEMDGNRLQIVGLQEGKQPL